MKVFVGGVTPEGEQIIKRYLDEFAPDAEIVVVEPAGIRGRMKSRAGRADVLLVIIDTTLADLCKGVADAVLALPKVHIYRDDDSLNQFMISQFGRLSSDIEAGGIVVSSESSDSVADTPTVADEDDDDTLIDEFLNDDNDFSQVQITKVESAEETIARLTTELDKANMLVRNLTGELQAGADTSTKEYISRIRVLEEQLEEARKEYSELEDESYRDKGKLVKAEKSIDELKTLRDEVRKGREENAELVFEKSELEKQIGTLQEKLEGLSGVREELAEKIEELSSVQSDLNSLNNKYNTLESQKGVLNEQYESLRRTSNETEDTLAAEKKRADGLAESIKTLNIDLDSIRSALEKEQLEVIDLKTALTSKTDSYIELQAKLSVVTDERDSYADKAKTHKEKVGILEADVSDLTERLQSAEKSVSNLQEQLTLAKAGVRDVEALQARYDALQEKEDDLVSKAGRVPVLEKRISELETENRKLQEADSKSVTELTAKLESMERRYKQLEKDYTILKDNDNTAELQDTISVLRSELETAKKSVSTGSSTEIEAVRSHCADVELELVEARDTIADLQGSVFTRMLGCALPKVMMNVELPVSQCNNLMVYCSASPESHTASYRVLKEACEAYNGDVIVIDLSEDTSADVEFGARGMQLPLEWFLGTQPIDGYLVQSSNIPNVRVASVGLTYMNMLYLLTVDWEARLKELDALGCKVIFHVGCVDDMVTKVLFQSFIRGMRGVTVVKATPINIRSAILTFAGISVDSMEVKCVSFDKASESVYKKLAQKYNSSILGREDVLVL